MSCFPILSQTQEGNVSALMLRSVKELNNPMSSLKLSNSNQALNPKINNKVVESTISIQSNSI